MGIEVRNITKTFGAFTALKDVSLSVATGELVALLGPSGSGKTTLLRLIAGLEAPDAGQILFQGEDATTRRAADRRVGFVFQHYALFRHMTVFDNIAFGLKVRPRATRPAKAQIRERVMSLLHLVQLEALYDRYPLQLSGGQRQRVALARALAVEPHVLLLDEPFGALDAQIRQELRRWLRKLHDELHITSVFVTHDQEEALQVSDRVVVMNEGKIEQMGTPAEVYAHPANPFVFKFLGSVNLFQGRLHQGVVQIGEARVEAPEHREVKNKMTVVYVRPHDIEVDRMRQDHSIEATVSSVHPIGPSVRLELALTRNGQQIEAEVSREKFQELKLQPGERAFIRFRNPQVFPGKSQEDYRP